MFLNFASLLFLFVCLHCFAVTDAAKNNLKHANSEVLFKLSNLKAGLVNTEHERNLNLPVSACDCGRNSIGCKIIDDKKICDCKEGYAQGKAGFCDETCNETRPCENGGSCLQHFCACLPGTYGLFCESIYDCLRTRMCGKDDNTYCSYDVSRQKAVCKCRIMEWRFDEATQTCKSCLCTDWSIQNLGSFSWCDFQQGQQVCVCTEGYSYKPRTGECEKCDCGPHSNWCAFDDKWGTRCGCQEGYFEYYGYKCEECLCGEHGMCDGKTRYPYCVCDEGYAEHEGICVECTCGKYGTCLYDENKKQVGCKCEIGYAEKMGKCEKCYCGDNINCTFDGDKKVCSCDSGYEDANGFCQDINECEKHNPCNESMRCINLLGSFECICKEGFKPASVDTLIKPYEICQDIDECENFTICAQPNTFCENTVGSYKCICESGFVSRGMLSSSLLCEKSTAPTVYTTIVITSIVSLIITGTVLYYVKKKSQRSYSDHNQELR